MGVTLKSTVENDKQATKYTEWAPKTQSASSPGLE
jgi:hypothetical protein